MWQINAKTKAATTRYQDFAYSLCPSFLGPGSLVTLDANKFIFPGIATLRHSQEAGAGGWIVVIKTYRCGETTKLACSLQATLYRYNSRICTTKRDQRSSRVYF